MVFGMIISPFRDIPRGSLTEAVNHVSAAYFYIDRNIISMLTIIRLYDILNADIANNNIIYHMYYGDYVCKETLQQSLLNGRIERAENRLSLWASGNAAKPI